MLNKWRLLLFSIKMITIHILGTMNIYAKFHISLISSSHIILCCIKALRWPTDNISDLIFYLDKEDLALVHSSDIHP